MAAGVIGKAANETTVARLSRLARQVPVTVALVSVMVVLGVVTQSLWSPLKDRELLPVVAYGLPALQEGRWWTPVSGAFFALVPAQYLPIAGGALLLLGWSELRLGSRRVTIAAVACHLLGVLGASLVLLVLSRTGWSWADRTAAVLDVGFSAGALGAAAAASVTLDHPGAAGSVPLLALYAVIALLYVGLLWDLEHAIAVMGGLALGPLLVGSKPSLAPPRFSRHEWRVVSSAFYVTSAVIQILLYFTPSDGPLGASTDDTDALGVLVSAAISLLLANGLRRGSRRVWFLAGGIAALSLRGPGPAHRGRGRRTRTAQRGR